MRQSIRLLKCLAVFCGVFFLSIGGDATAQRAEDLISEDLRLPSPAGPDSLEAFLVKPNTAGRHPLVLVNHGSPRDAADRTRMTARSMMPQLSEFARRGFVAVAVLRRGYGTSLGNWAESYGPCDNPDYYHAGEAGAADLKAAIGALVRRPDIDARHILSVGVSAGGFATVALTSEPPTGLVAAISFAGGRGSQGPDDVCRDQRLVDAVRLFGRTSRVPMLWVYAPNDHFFDPPLASRLLAAFNGAGGRATFLAAPAYGEEGHFLFSGKGRPIWVPIVEAYLRRTGLMARGAPTASLAPPRGLSARGLEDFQKFLDAGAHKAFAVSEGGGYGWRTGRASVGEATEAAIAACRGGRNSACRLYAVDGAYSDGW